MLDGGLERVYYVDLDAHHGDGVEYGFADDDRVLTVSVHEAGRWPYTGKVEERAGGLARNLPVPIEFNDSELAYIVDEALMPLGRRFDADAVVIQCGADALADDPMSRLGLSNRALWAAVAELSTLAPRVLVLGWRLQSVVGRALLGRRLGDAQGDRPRCARDTGRGGSPAGADLDPPAGTEPAGTLVHHDSRRAAPRTCARRHPADRRYRHGMTGWHGRTCPDAQMLYIFKALL